MKNSLSVNVDKPCHENWAEMSPRDKGRFCAKCTKEVIDFTTLNDAEIYAEINLGKNLCGRFRKDQLDRPLSVSQPWVSRSKYVSIPQLAAAILIPTAIFMSTSIQAQTPHNLPSVAINAVSADYHNQIQGMVSASPIVTVKGRVFDNENLPLPGVNIKIKGNTKGEQTNSDGEFELKTKVGTTIVLSYIGFKPKEYIVTSSHALVEFKMEWDEVLLGDVIVTGKLRPQPIEKSKN